MKKETAIQLLGGTAKKAALALGYKSVQAIYMWPETLSIEVADRVNGAASRIKTVRKSRVSKAQAVTEGV